LNEKTAKLINKYVGAVVPKDLENSVRIQRLVAKKVKDQWKTSTAKERASLRQVLRKAMYR